jgi:hypothetical protein
MRTGEGDLLCGVTDVFLEHDSSILSVIGVKQNLVPDRLTEIRSLLMGDFKAFLKLVALAIDVDECESGTDFILDIAV